MGLLALTTAAIGGFAHAASEPSSWPPRTQTSPLGAQPTAPSARLYLLKFRDVPVAEVAEEVLGGALNVPYALDPTVEGVMTFEVNERLTPAQLLDRFEAALQSNGVAIRATGSQFVLSPAKAALAAETVSPAPILTVTPEPSPPGGWRIAGLLGACAAVGAVSAVWMTRQRRRRPASPAREAVLDYLVESGAVGRKDVARARLIARREGGLVETVLERDGLVLPDALAEAYSAAAGVAIWRPDLTPPMDPQPRYSPEPMSEALLVLADDGAKLTVATSDPLDDAVISRLLFASGRTIRLQVASRQDIAEARESLRSLHVVGHIAG